MEKIASLITMLERLHTTNEKYLTKDNCGAPPDLTCEGVKCSECVFNRSNSKNIKADLNKLKLILNLSE